MKDIRTVKDLKELIEKALSGVRVEIFWDCQLKRVLQNTDILLTVGYTNNHTCYIKYQGVEICTLKYHARMEKPKGCKGIHFVKNDYYYTYFEVSDPDRDIVDYVETIKNIEKIKREEEGKKGEAFLTKLCDMGFGGIDSFIDFIDENANDEQRKYISWNVR